METENKQKTLTKSANAKNKKKSVPRKKTKMPALIEIMVIICEKNSEENVTKMLNFLNVDLQLLSIGEGTADGRMRDLMGLTGGEKRIITCLIKVKDKENIFNSLNSTLFVKQKQIGIAFTIPVVSALSNVLDRMGFMFLKNQQE